MSLACKVFFLHTSAALIDKLRDGASEACHGTCLPHVRDNHEVYACMWLIQCADIDTCQYACLIELTTCLLQVMVLLAQQQWSWQQMSLRKLFNWKVVQVRPVHGQTHHVKRLRSSHDIKLTSVACNSHSTVEIPLQADI